MKSYKTRIVIAAVAMLIMVSPLRMSADWQSHVKKTWEFKLQQGTLKILLLVDPSFPDVSCLELLCEAGAHPSLAEEVSLLRDVVHQLPGINPNSLRAISMRGFMEPEIAQRIAIAALHSKTWNSHTKMVGGAERVVGDLLNSLGAYDTFNSAVEEYGLVVTVQGVEKVASASCMGLNLSDPVCNIHNNVKVPIGANIRLAIVRKGEAQRGIRATSDEKAIRRR